MVDDQRSSGGVLELTTIVFVGGRMKEPMIEPKPRAQKGSRHFDKKVDSILFSLPLSFKKRSKRKRKRS